MNHEFYAPLCCTTFNGCRGDPTRTGDRLVPNQERYQLRYTPKSAAKVALSGDTSKFQGKKNSSKLEEGGKKGILSLNWGGKWLLKGQKVGKSEKKMLRTKKKCLRDTY